MERMDGDGMGWYEFGGEQTGDWRMGWKLALRADAERTRRKCFGSPSIGC